MSASNDLENKVLDHVLGNTTYSPEATLYLALFTGDSGLEDNNPTAEVSGTNYAREAISFNAASNGEATNNGAISFTSAGSNWGDVSHIAIVSHVSNTTWGTNVDVLFYGELTSAKTVNSGDTFQVADEAIRIALD